MNDKLSRRGLFRRFGQAAIAAPAAALVAEDVLADVSTEEEVEDDYGYRTYEIVVSACSTPFVFKATR